ncbi:hypothetical protein [Brunnivagina elsteri]|nr:hypothetical protein [Calothrix elsteri]
MDYYDLNAEQLTNPKLQTPNCHADEGSISISIAIAISIASKLHLC